LIKITAFVMGAGMFPETPAIFKQVKRLIARGVLRINFFPDVLAPTFEHKADLSVS
jgi:hypothetical protein